MKLLPELVKDGEVSVDQNEFGILVDTFIRDCLRRNNSEEWLEPHIRRWWPKVENYYHRSIICSIEVAIALDEPPRYSRLPLDNKEMWKRLAKELRDPRSEFTVDYTCDKCNAVGVKLWRGVHGAMDDHGYKLLCAKCVAPGEKVSDDGRCQEPDYKSKDAYGNTIPGMMTDQIHGWLPAVPVGDTFWGYGSVPSQDIEWWVGLPTYQK
jgi:hypothetical protein